MQLTISKPNASLTYLPVRFHRVLQTLSLSGLTLRRFCSVRKVGFMQLLMTECVKAIYDVSSLDSKPWTIQLITCMGSYIQHPWDKCCSRISQGVLLLLINHVLETVHLESPKEQWPQFFCPTQEGLSWIICSMTKRKNIRRNSKKLTPTSPHHE